MLQGLQRQIALVAKLLRDEVDPVTLAALQNRYTHIWALSSGIL
jgi:hypothetical protein